MRHKLFVSLVLALCLGLMASSAFAVNFIVNPGFEDGAGDTAPPWSYWGGTGGAMANPYPDVSNPSPRVWFNFDNPTYVNVAAQNNMSNVWLIPGATYRVKAQFYVPSSEIKPGITPRAGVYLTMMSGMFRILDPRYPDSPDNAASPDVPADQWHSYDFNWVCPGNPGDAPIQCSYLSLRMFGGTGTTLGVDNPGCYFDNCEFSSDAYTGVISGVVKTSSGTLEGAMVQLSFMGEPVATVYTGANGAFSFVNLIPGQSYSVSVSKSMYVGYNASATASANLGDIVLAPDANYNPDILFNVKSSDLTGADGDVTGNWATVNPSGGSLTVINNPTVAEINGQKWVANTRDDMGGYRFAGPANGEWLDPIPVNGATIVAAVRPVRSSVADGWNSVVDIFYDRLVLAVRNSDGMIGVRRNGSLDWSTTAIPNGQITILSVVVQPDNSYKVYANGGLPIMDVAADPERAAMDALVPGSPAHTHYINVGRNNPDGWTAFNGNIGDVYVYKKAINDTQRTALESELASKYGTFTFDGVINGVVKTSSGPLEGALVQLRQNGVLQATVTTGATGAFSFGSLMPGESYSILVSKSAYVAFSTTATASANLGDIVLVADSNYDPDILFNAKSSDLTGAIGEVTGDWVTVNPTGGLLNMIATPTVAEINGQKWVNNLNADGDGYRFASPAGGMYDQPIAINGASIIAAVRPARFGNPNNWQSVVDIFYNRLVLAVRNGDGQVGVWRNGNLEWSSTALPNGQITVLSLVVQPSGTYKVFANGTEIMNIETTSDMYALDPLWNGGGTGFWSYINVGRNNPDGWTTFNGNIGDVYVYKKAIDDAQRTAIEAELTSKYGTSPVYTITASAGAGGAISPSGVVEVPMSTNRSFTITPNKYFDVTGLVIDGAPVTVENPNAQVYTFTNVNANHTIAVSFTEWVETYITGKVALADNTPVEGALVTAAGGREPYTATTAADGTFSIRVKPGVDYTLTAFKRGYTMDPASLAAGPGNLTAKNFVATFVGTQKLIDIKVDPAWGNGDPVTSWPNTGILGGQFIADGGKDTAAATVSDSYVGKKAVVFANSKLMLSSDATTADTSLIRAPGSITGNGAYTVYTEICTTTELPWEQWYFGFAKTGGNGNAACFGYGRATNWGAVAHWGSTDMGWSNPEVEGGPAINKWHQFAITFDGATEIVYVDGLEVNRENKTLALYANNPFAVGSRFWDDNGWGRDGAFNGAIASLEVYDGALTAAQIASKAGYVVLSGKVTLEDGVTPIAGVAVEAQGVGDEGGDFRTTVTAADGTYAIPVTAGWFWNVWANKLNYQQVNDEYYDYIEADTEYNIQMKVLRSITGTVRNAQNQPIYNAVVQVGEGGPAAVTGADGKYTIIGIEAASGVSFYADALGYADNTEIIDTSAAASGVMTRDVVLTAKNEIGVIQNGGFENGLAPWYRNYGTPEVGITSDEKASGNSAGYWEATEAGWYMGYLVQRVPVLPGSTYNVYYKLKTNAVGALGQSGFDWLNASGGSLGWWGYRGGGDNWMYTPAVGTWEQVLQYRSANNAQHMTAVRMTPPDGAEFIQIIVGLGNTAIGDRIFVDDVVIDRVGPDPTTISGRVTAGAGGPGVANAVVFASTESPASPSTLYATTDANGYYTIDMVMAGTYYLTARKAGYVANADVTVVVAASPASAADIVMSAVPTSKLVDLKADTYSNGTWPNAGSLGGQFNCDTATTPAKSTVDNYTAVNFNGAQRLLSTVTAPDQITGNGAFTVSAWLYGAPGSNYGSYFAWVKGMATNLPESACFMYDTDPAWGAADFGVVGIGFNTLPSAGKWHHVAVTYDHATVRIYVDGQLDSSTPAILNQLKNQPFSVGATYTNDDGSIPQWFLTGALASIEVWDADKDAAAITALYNAGPDGNGVVVRKPVGANNKSVLTDDLLVGKYVRVWGKIVSKGATSYVIDDGYGAGVTINGTTTKAVGEMVVVNGTVGANKSITP